ncbi:MAG: DNA repair protein RadC [Spirochaetales bacterium]|nr:DNA repair protein RadC [Spirochaetales bacterium]
MQLYERGDAEYSERPDVRERLERDGPGGLADWELVAAVLGSGNRNKDVRALARDIVAKSDLSRGVPSVEALSAHQGMGRALACRISAALELGKRFYGHRGRRISGPEDVWQLVRHFDDGRQERFICCMLNGANDVIDVKAVTVGLINRTIVHPREIYAEAVAARSCALIACHNHPSGRLEPSPEDLDITERLRQAGEVLGIPLLDHVIFSQDGWISLVESGKLRPR